MHTILFVVLQSDSPESHLGAVPGTVSFAVLGLNDQEAKLPTHYHSLLIDKSGCLPVANQRSRRIFSYDNIQWLAQLDKGYNDGCAHKARFDT